ncbi:nicotinate-nicotinamide nucleotide adenylyltransferase [Vibrio sp. RC27]
MRNIAVFGSAFNPPSFGHKNVIESLTQFDLILLVPSIAHAWGKEMLDFQLRCELVEAFIDDLAPRSNRVELCRVEEELLESNQSVTTYQLLNYLAELYSADNLTFIIGPDNLMNFGKFYNADKIMDHFSVMALPEKVKVRSTDIRTRLQNKESVEGLTTPSVIKLIEQTQSYQ